MINRRFGYTISVMNGDFMKNIKKILHTFTAAVMAVSTLAFSAVCTAQGAEQSAQADVLYAESFADSNIKSGYVLANDGYYQKGFVGGKGGKAASDISLNFKRPETESTSSFGGNNIYTYFLAPTNAQYIKYELNFMPNDVNFKEIKFATQGHTSISPSVRCSDSGNGTAYALERYKWNKIVFIVKNNTLPVDNTKNEMSFSVDLFVNGKEICKNAAYTGKKNGNLPTSEKTAIRFAIYASDEKLSNGNILYKTLDTYIDDVKISAYENYPNIDPMPYLVTDGKKMSVLGNVLNVYEPTDAGNLKCSSGANIAVFDTPTYDYRVVGGSKLSSGNLVVLSDENGNMTYYTVKTDLRNDASLSYENGKLTASANIRNAMLVLALYDEKGNLVNTGISKTNGKTSVTLGGEFSLAKAMVMGYNLAPMCEVKTYVSRPSVACWGDSITYGQGSGDVNKYSYPAVLKDLSGLNVINMGVGGETNTTIAARQGGYSIKLDEDFVIPQDTVPIEIKFSAYDKNGNYAGVVTPRSTTLGGWSPCKINGVEGKLSIDVNNTVFPRILNWAKFTRFEKGESVSVKKGDVLTVGAHDVNADINIINASSNGGWGAANKNASDSDGASLINTLDNMIESFKYPDKFIVIGVTTGGTDAWAKTDAALKGRYGKHFLDVKSYLTDEKFLTDNGIILTAADKEYLALGKIPPSLLDNSPQDNTHLNKAGYRLFAQKVYDKMIELGFAE